MHVLFRRLLILSTFLSLGLLETFHFVMANKYAVYRFLHLHSGWWITLQSLQIALFCLLALLVFGLIAGRHGTTAKLSRLGLLVFLLCSLTYAGVIGIGTGLLVAHADALALVARVCLGSQSSIVQAITTDSGNPIGTGLWVLGSLGWMVGVLAALLVLSTKNDLDVEALNLPILHAEWVA
jgi:MFS family permease